MLLPLSIIEFKALKIAYNTCSVRASLSLKYIAACEQFVVTGNDMSGKNVCTLACGLLSRFS